MITIVLMLVIQTGMHFLWEKVLCMHSQYIDLKRGKYENMNIWE